MSGRARTTAVRLALPALFLAPLSAAWAQEDRWRHGPLWDGWGWGHFVFGPLMMILFIATIVVVVVLIVRWLGGPGGGAAPTRAARDALDDRYARGEIDREEYLEKKKDLS